MAAVSAAHRKQIDSAIAAGKPEAAFAILQGYADLRHADMPPLSKDSLRAIGNDAAAMRRFVLGSGSTSLSVRRFCRKHLPKLAEAAASPLLALAADALDPFRPGDGLLGSFGGVVSPLARTILDEEMSFELKSANHAYSDAGRYGKEVMDDVIFLVGATSYEHLIRFCEYQWGTGRIVGRASTDGRDWPHADYMVAWSHQVVQETLAKDRSGWGEALIRWTSGRTLLLDEASDDPVVCELACRVRARGPEAVAKLKEELVVQNARIFHGLSQEHRMALYRNLSATLSSWSPKLKPYFERALADYRQTYPGEAEQAGQETPVIAAPGTSPAPAASATAPAAGLPARDDSTGPSAQRALLTVLRLAFDARLPRLHATINDSLDKLLRDREAPEDGGRADDANTLAALHQVILEHRGTRPGIDPKASRSLVEDITYVPDRVLESAPFAGALADLLIRMIGEKSGLRLAAAAATVLSREGLDRFGEAWAARSPARGPHDDDRNLLDPLAQRRIAPVALLRSIFTQSGEHPVELTESWQRAVALLYVLGGDAGRTAALTMVARHPYPKEVNEYANRRDFYDPHQATMWAAWERRDAELLAIAFERFAIPYFWKGSKALLSKREPFFISTGYAARSDTGEGAPLADVWKLVEPAGRVAATVRASLQRAELCEAPRTFLELASPEAFSGLGDDVLPLLESSNPTVLATGLAILGRAPACVADRPGEAVTLAGRALTSTRSGAAKEAAVALAALGNAHASVRAQAFSALADGLALEAAPVLQAILKSMKQLPGKLPGDARQRIVELSNADPAKFEKLVKPLLAA